MECVHLLIGGLSMCEIYGFCGSVPTDLHKYTDEFWLHSRVHQDGFGFYLADRNDFYVNENSAMTMINALQKKRFTSKLALCHIRFKTHGPASVSNCHPFIFKDAHGTEWSLIHNGYIDDTPVTAALGIIQQGDTDSERILLTIIETVNSFYEHSFIEDEEELLNKLYIRIESTLSELSDLGKVNLIFTDNKTHNMYVYMNHPNTLFYLQTDKGIHISTTKLSNEAWVAVEPYKLHILNNGKKLDY
jgi:glutamine amidotransferase